MLENNGLSVADLAAVVGNGNNDGFGGNSGGWAFWILILLLFANGWGYGNNGGGGGQGGPGGCNVSMIPQYMTNVASSDQVSNGFNQLALTNGLTDISSALSNGFANAEISRANTLAAITGQMNNIAMNQQQCCCDNRLATVQLGNTISQEACLDRQAINDGVRDLMAQNTANTNALMGTMTSSSQAILDKLCQLEMDGIKQNYENRISGMQNTIDSLRTQVSNARYDASQVAQNAFIAQGFAQEVDDLYNRLNNCPVPTTPVYGRTPIFTCPGGQGFNGCGCGNN